MRDGHEKGVGLHHHFAITEFAGDFDLARNTGQFFKPVTRDHTGVIAGTAGDDLHIAHFGEQLGGLRTEGLNQHLIVAQATFEGALDHGRLLVDFLEHVVAELALVGGFGTVGVLHGLALDSVAVHVPDLHAVAADLSDIALFQVHETVSDLTQGQLVGGEEVLAQAQTDHQWAATARGDQTIRLLRIDHRQTVSAMQFLHRSLEGGRKVRLFLELVRQQMGDDLGVGVRAERITQGFQLFAQGLVVLDDAVVHHRDVTGKMRVGVAFARRAMGRPTGVGNTETAGQRVFGQRSFQLADLARTAHALQGFVVGVNRHTGAVVAAVFEALQAFEEDGGDITFSYSSDNATHGYFS